MAKQTAVNAALVLWGTSFLVGIVATLYRTTARRNWAADPPSSSREMFRFGIQLAKLPAVVLFVLLTIRSVAFNSLAGQPGGLPPAEMFLLETVGLVSFLAVSIGGLTLAGSLLAVSLRRYTT